MTPLRPGRRESAHPRKQKTGVPSTGIFAEVGAPRRGVGGAEDRSRAPPGRKESSRTSWRRTGSITPVLLLRSVLACEGVSASDRGPVRNREHRFSSVPGVARERRGRAEPDDQGRHLAGHRLPVVPPGQASLRATFNRAGPKRERHQGRGGKLTAFSSLRICRRATPRATQRELDDARTLVHRRLLPGHHAAARRGSAAAQHTTSLPSKLRAPAMPTKPLASPRMSPTVC